MAEAALTGTHVATQVSHMSRLKTECPQGALRVQQPEPLNTLAWYVPTL
jgi:hypothetical protein